MGGRRLSRRRGKLFGNWVVIGGTVIVLGRKEMRGVEKELLALTLRTVGATNNWGGEKVGKVDNDTEGQKKSLRLPAKKFWQTLARGVRQRSVRTEKPSNL